MKTYLDLCEDCDRLPEYPEDCYKFQIEGFPGVFGHLIEPTVQAITRNECWVIDHGSRTVTLLGDTQELRCRRMDDLLKTEKARGTFRVLDKWSGEQINVYGPDREVVLQMERVAAPLFGIVTYAVQLILYREVNEHIFVWLARRAPTKWLYPNKLGVTVAGGVRAAETPMECVVREAAEEAGLENELVKKHAKPAGTVHYATTTDSETTSGGEAGLIREEVQFLYEMKVDALVVPRPFDGEASDISLYSVKKIKKTLREGEFTPGNACYILAFLIRHGILTPENEPNYTKIITRLNRSLGVHTA